eukprot:350621-Chlamydomonas_euryale.AAC.11
MLACCKAGHKTAALLALPWPLSLPTLADCSAAATIAAAGTVTPHPSPPNKQQSFARRTCSSSTDLKRSHVTFSGRPPARFSAWYIGTVPTGTALRSGQGWWHGHHGVKHPRERWRIGRNRGERQTARQVLAKPWHRAR